MKSLYYLVFISTWYLLRFLFVLNDRFFYVSFLDVGQGDAIVINVPRLGQLLVDTGADYQSNYMYARGRVFPNCAIKSVFITHYDNDHSGGLQRILRFCRGATVYDNLSRGDVLVFNDVRVYMLSPKDKGSTHQENDASLVMLVKYNDFEALLTGDAGLSVLEAALPVVNDLKESNVINGVLDVYKISHHGSLHNSSLQLLDLLGPLNCVVSVGRNNYGHPSKEVLGAAVSVGCVLYRTDQDGSVTFASGP